MVGWWDGVGMEMRIWIRMGARLATRMGLGLGRHCHVGVAPVAAVEETSIR
jgi:hypothetical protein